jgi:hypothetical protein
MKKQLNQQQQIFWKGNICEEIKWETLTSKKELVVIIKGQFYSVKINQLSNKQK